MLKKLKVRREKGETATFQGMRMNDMNVLFKLKFWTLYKVKLMDIKDLLFANKSELI